MKRASRRLESSLIGFARRALGVAIVLPLVVSGLDRVLGEAANTPEVKRAQHALEQARNDQALIPKARQAAEEALRGVSTRHSSVCELTGSLHRRHKGEPISVPSQQLLAIAMECAQAAEIHADPKLDLRSTPERVEAFRLAWCGFTRAGDAQRTRVAAEQAIGSLVAWMDTFGADQARIDDALRTHARLVVDVIVGWGGVMDDGRNYPEALKSFNQAEEFIKLRLPDETHARSVCADSKGLVLIHLGQYALALQAFRDSLQLSLAKKPVNKWEVIDRREKICQTLVRIDNRKALKEEATALARDLDELLTDDSTMASTELTARSMVIEACLATDLDSAVANRCCERIDKLGDLIDEQLPDSLPETIGLIASRIAMSHWKISLGDKVEAQRCLSDAQRRLQLIRMGAQRIGTGDDLLADYDYQLGLANMALGQYRTAAAHFDQHRQLAWNRNLDSLVCAPLFSQYLINAIEIAPRMNVAANLAWQAPNDPGQRPRDGRGRL